MQKLVFINGAGTQIDLTSGNFGITNWAGLSNVSLNLQTQQVPFEDGAVFIDALMEPREIELTLAIYDGNNLELRYQKKRELISALNPKLGEGILIYTNDYISRQTKAVPQIPLFENKNSNDPGTLKASVAFSCPSPYWEDVEETLMIIKGNTTEIVENKGDVNTQFEIQIKTKNAEDITLENENKKMQISGNITSDFVINTNTGSKNIYLTNINKKILTNLESFTRICDFCYSKKHNTICIVGKGIILLQNNTPILIPSENKYSSVCYSEELDLYCASYNSNSYKCVSISTDGINWETDTTQGFNIVYYSSYHNKFIGIKNEGSDKSIYISEDGANWTVAYENTTQIYKRIAVNEETGDVVIIRNYDGILKSNDLETWVYVHINDTLYSKDIIFVKNFNKFFIIGYLANRGGGKIYCSENGTTWTSCYGYSPSSGGVAYFYSSTYSDGFDCILVIGNEKKDSENNFVPIMSVSYDGVHWETKRNGIPEDETFDGDNLKIKWINNNYYFMMKSFYSSKDSKLWEKVLEYPYYVQKAIYYKKLGLYIGIDAYNIKVSEDGESWKTVYTETWDLKDIQIINEDILVCVASPSANNGRLLKSQNGINWEIINVGWKCNTIGVTGALGYTYYIGTNNTVRYSNNLTNWSWSGYISSITNINVKKIATKYVPSNVSWKNVVIGSTKKLYQGYGTSSYSQINYGDYELNDIIYIEKYDLFLAVGEGGHIIKSYDGMNWTSIVLNITNNLLSIKQTEYNGIIIVGDANIVIRTYDLKQWDIITNNLTSSSSMDCIELKNVDLLCMGNIGIKLNLNAKGEDIINRLSSDSVFLNIEKGKNYFTLSTTSGNVIGLLKYRQKYIGV